MKVGVMTIGDEVLQGRILDRNKANLGKFFLARGIEVSLSINPPDEARSLKKALIYMLEEVDLIVITGGLGQTKDDMTYRITREVCEGYQEEIIPNHNGAAHGYLLKKGTKSLILVPGPPNENQPMFEVIDKVLDRQELYEKIYHLMGIGEYDLERSFEKNFGDEAQHLLTYVSIGYVSLRVFSRDQSQLFRLCQKVEEVFGDYIFYEDEMDIEVQLLEKLRQGNLSISLAESVTAGGLMKRLTSITGASDVVYGGLVVYQDRAKTQLLGISPELLKSYTSVSSQASLALARTSRIKTGADICLGITGYAEHEDEELRGLCYIHIVSPWGEDTFFRKVPSRERNRSREAMINFALASLWKTLAKMPSID